MIKKTFSTANLWNSGPPRPKSTFSCSLVERSPNSIFLHYEIQFCKLNLFALGDLKSKRKSRTNSYLHVVPRTAKSMPGTAKEQDGLATLNTKTAWLLDCDWKITKLTRQAAHQSIEGYGSSSRNRLQSPPAVQLVIFHICTWTSALIIYFYISPSRQEKNIAQL